MTENARLEIRLSAELRERAEQLAVAREMTISAWVKQVTRQEVLNTMAAHLLKQGVKSLNPDGSCCYLSHEGLKCAVGCLISDDEYCPEMEGKDVECLGDLLPERLRPHLDLISDGQNTHDELPVESWPSELRAIAEEFGLEIPEGCR